MHVPLHREAALRVVELMLEDRQLSNYIITRTNERVGRVCADSEEKTDSYWWGVHRAIFAAVLLEASAELDWKPRSF